MNRGETESSVITQCCRFCNTSNDLIDIFEDNADKKDPLKNFIVRASYNCFGVEIKKDDGLPSKLCCSCLEILNVCHSARQFVRCNDLVLRKNCLISNTLTKLDKTQIAKKKKRSIEEMPATKHSNSKNTSPKKLKPLEELSEDRSDSGSADRNSRRSSIYETDSAATSKDQTELVSTRGRRIKPVERLDFES